MVIKPAPWVLKKGWVTSQSSSLIKKGRVTSQSAALGNEGWVTSQSAALGKERLGKRLEYLSQSAALGSRPGTQANQQPWVKRLGNEQIGSNHDRTHRGAVKPKKKIL